MSTPEKFLNDLLRMARKNAAWIDSKRVLALVADEIAVQRLTARVATALTR